jgi:hypothetical protein
MEFLQRSILPQEQQGYQPKSAEKNKGKIQIMEHYHILLHLFNFYAITPVPNMRWKLEGIYDRDCMIEKWVNTELRRYKQCKYASRKTVNLGSMHKHL